MLNSIEPAKESMHKKNKSESNFKVHQRQFSLFENSNATKHKPKPSKYVKEEDFFEFSEES